MRAVICYFYFTVIRFWPWQSFQQCLLT